MIEMQAQEMDYPHSTMTHDSRSRVLDYSCFGHGSGTKATLAVHICFPGPGQVGHFFTALASPGSGVLILSIAAPS